ncbi:hypothetical protein [Bradyrhizobium sp.]|uniref:phosphorylase family protein n=1 Tax=Bradyrhizobium sp. TaxID=376 RepID=UPI003C7763B5
MGVVGRVVGASFAVLVAEELFASGCRLLISLTSAGQIVPSGSPPYFIIIDRALRDEGTSYHYMPTSEFAEADLQLVQAETGKARSEQMSSVAGSCEVIGLSCITLFELDQFAVLCRAY